MPLFISKSQKAIIAVMTIALLGFSIMMLTVEDHDSVSFGTKASVLHSEHGAADTSHSDHEVQASTESHNHGSF